MRALDLLRGTARDSMEILRSQVTDVRQGLQMFESWRVGHAQFPTTNYRTLSTQSYMKSELVYACIREVATSVSQAPFRVVVEKDDIQIPVKDHPVWELMDDPNEIMSGYDFWEAELVIEQIAGNCHVWKERGANDRPTALWILRPDWVRWVPKRDIRQSFYIYSPDGSFTNRNDIPIPMEDMMHFKYGVHPMQIYSEGLSPTAVCFRNTILDNDATDFMKVFFDNAGAPSGIITVKRRLKDQREANRIRKRWQERYSGLKGWHSPAVLDEDAEYKRVGLDFREMAMDALRDVPETRICMAYGVPPIIVGSNVGLKRSTYTNYPAAKSSFWEETLAPKYAQLATRVTKDLIEIDFPSAIAAKADFDLTNVSALREATGDIWKRATAALNVGGITINMFLQEIGKEPVDGGDVFLIPGNREQKEAPQTGRALVSRIGSVRYSQLFTQTEQQLLEEAS